MKRLLNLYARKPLLLDLTIAVALLPLFCHSVVAIHSKRTVAELFQMRGYWIPMAISYGCGLAVMAYIRWNNERIGRRFGIDDEWDSRAAHQFRWNLLPPVAFVTLVIAGYFAYFGQSIFRRGYLRKELFLVWMGVTLLMLIYYVHNKHRYFWKRQREQQAYERFKGLPAGTGTTIGVLHPQNRRDTVCLPMEEVAVIDRHNGRTTVSTWDGRKFEWPMPATEMKTFAADHGYTWLGQHYALQPAAVVASEGIGHQGRRLLLRPGISVTDEKQVLNVNLEDQQRLYLVFHKNIAKEVGDWFDRTH